MSVSTEAMICVEVVGRPAPKGSRIAGKTKRGKFYTYPASQHEAPWVAAVADATRVVMRHHPTPDPPYRVELVLRIARPLRGAPSAYPWPTQHDLDKLARSVIDGLVKGKAMVDDRHVLLLTVEKDFVSTDEEPGVSAQITSL
jgi:Holliday junction resolvase RusA-like endonuclease